MLPTVHVRDMCVALLGEFCGGREEPLALSRCAWNDRSSAFAVTYSEAQRVLSTGEVKDTHQRTEQLEANNTSESINRVVIKYVLYGCILNSSLTCVTIITVY
eukprot:TRINITY_DN16757_c0_g1_i1.p2 TRINITY_DN16757_c0_g1~~TRINITY_DN16757_c0_g1_i1.p2  ORF type:complete len:103 (+),score=1.02 TRINITY_DN16757_c0_g1_i1:290-598(+)